MRTKGKKQFAEITFYTIVILLLLVISCIGETRLRNELSVISNPTFVGIVVDKDSTIHRRFTVPMIPTVYRLHIIGTYYEGNEIRRVDRIFRVPRAFYQQYEIGNIIGQSYVQ